MANRTVKTRVTNAVLYDDGLIRIDNCIASYPHLDKAWAGEEGQEKKFAISGLMPKDTHRAAKDLIKKAIEALIAENKAKVPSEKWFLKDGDKTEKPEQQGRFMISARESRRPAVRNADKSIMDQDEIAEKIYAGCRVSILIRPWFQDHKKFGKRVNAGLVAVQFMRDDEPISEGRISDDDVDEMFDEYEEGGSDGGGMDDDENDL
jgi:hypothetical protein